MSRPVSHGTIIAKILDKDVLRYSRDTVYLVLTIVGLIIFVAVFYFVPDSVDETITLGIHQTDLEELIEEYEKGSEGEGLDLVQFETEAILEGIVADDLEAWKTEAGDIVVVDREAGDQRPDNAERLEVAIGIAFPDDFAIKTRVGENATVKLYSDAAVPPEIKGAMASFVRQIAYGIAGDDLPVTQPDEENFILGVDRTGDQVSLREKMRPMLAFFVLMIETFSLASLIASEVSQKTITAILVTPATIGDVLASKTIFGSVLAFVQALLLLILVGAFTAQNWWLLSLIILMGAVMFTGIGMIIGSAGKDFMGTLFYGVALIVPLSIPAVAVLFPGTAALWIQLLPTYGIVQTLNQVAAYGAGFSEVAPYVAMTAAWLVAIYFTGVYTLKRKVESL
jgi:ABC-2 type transport system permease protein